MIDKYGTDQILKVLDVIIEAGNVVPAVNRTNTIIGKIGALLPLCDEIAAVISLKPDQLKKEWKDLTDAEKNLLMVHVKDKYDIEDDDLEAKIEEGLVIVKEVVECTERAIAFVKSFKKGK
jgi:hypothetical protein